MIIVGSKRVAQRACVNGFRVSNYYATAVNAGPAGSATMTWVTVMQFTRFWSNSSTQWFFSRLAAATGNTGWIHYLSAGVTYRAGVASGAGAFTSIALDTIDAVNRAYPGRVLIMVSTLANGTLTGRMNTTAADVSTAVAGYTAASAALSTRIGLDDFPVSPAAYCGIMDCAMFNTYDGTSFVSTVYGNGLAGLIAMWQEDLQQGRYLSKPQGGALGASDWYWSSRDAVVGGGGTRATWTDRGANAVAMTKVGSPQGGAAPMVF